MLYLSVEEVQVGVRLEMKHRAEQQSSGIHVPRSLKVKACSRKGLWVRIWELELEKTEGKCITTIKSRRHGQIRDSISPDSLLCVTFLDS